MDKKGFILAIVASTLISVLAIPTVNNIPFLSGLMSQGATKIGFSLGLLSIVGYITTDWLGRHIRIFKQLGRFAIIGVLNTIVDFAVLNILISYTGIDDGLWANIFKGISFTVAVINSYYWNKYWAFESHTAAYQEFWQFIIVSIVGFGLNLAMFHTIVNVVQPLAGIDSRTWANLGGLAGTLIGFVANFVGYKLIVFRKTS